MPRRPIRTILTVLALVLAAVPAGAQSLPGTGNGAAAPAQAAPADALGRETPRGMVAGLLDALADADHARAARFLELDPALADSAAAGVARRLQRVLDRAGSVAAIAALSGEPAGRLDDGLSDDVEQFGTVSADGRETPLLARRVARGDAQIWLVSAATLQALPQLSARLADQAIGAALLERVPRGPLILGVPAAHWLALLLAAALAGAVAWAMTALRGPVLRLVARGRDAARVAAFLDACAGPARLLIAVGLFSVALQTLGVSLIARHRALFLAQLASGFAVAWLLWRLADAAGAVALEQMRRRGQIAAVSAVSFLTRLAKAILALVFLATVLRAFGVDVTTALAALGIGGLAIALGAQKLFENLLGSVTLIADSPIRIGDFCRFGDRLGTVEAIGIRSTRIRTLDRTVVTVPNGEFASQQIENFSPRDRFWFHPTLNLRYETTPEQMRFVLQELRAMLYAHPKVDPQPARVRFVALGAHSLDVEIFAYVHAPDFDGFLEVKEDLLLRCMEIVERAGTGFAFPSQTLYLGRDAPPDPERVERAEAAVRRWREAGELQLPRFHPDRIAQLRGTIAYPPEGAAIAAGARK